MNSLREDAAGSQEMFENMGHVSLLFVPTGEASREEEDSAESGAEVKYTGFAFIL